MDPSSALHFKRRFDATIRALNVFLCGLLLIYAALGRIWQVVASVQGAGDVLIT